MGWGEHELGVRYVRKCPSTVGMKTNTGYPILSTWCRPVRNRWRKARHHSKHEHAIRGPGVRITRALGEPSVSVISALICLSTVVPVLTLLSSLVFFCLVLFSPFLRLGLTASAGTTTSIPMARSHCRPRPAVPQAWPVLTGMVLHGIAWYGMVWYGIAWYRMVLHGIAWYGMVWYGKVHMSGAILDLDPLLYNLGRRRHAWNSWNGRVGTACEIVWVKG